MSATEAREIYRRHGLDDFMLDGAVAAALERLEADLTSVTAVYDAAYDLVNGADEDDYRVEVHHDDYARLCAAVRTHLRRKALPCAE
jgi:hypothetical protein